MSKTVKFLVHDHKAKRAGFHQDLRFQNPNRISIWMSFAVPKGIPLKPGTKVLAIRTHDHTKEEAEFQGDIPAGEYGGGTLTLFDQGLVRLEKFSSAHMVLYFQGSKIKGIYHLISIGNINNEYKQQQYLLFKSQVKETKTLQLSKAELKKYLKDYKNYKG